MVVGDTGTSPAADASMDLQSSSDVGVAADAAAADADMIDLVGMIFEHRLKDEDLPNVAKAELSRLHTPYLKVAIVDKRFFTDKTHPAHELLNTLANAVKTMMCSKTPLWSSN